MVMLMLFTLLTSLDYITGLAGAYVSKQIDSKITRTGLIRKSILLLVLWSLFGFVEWWIPTFIDPEYIFPFESMLSLIPTGFVIYEVVSLIENLGLLGVKIPVSVQNSFMRLKEQNDQKGIDTIPPKD